MKYGTEITSDPFYQRAVPFQGKVNDGDRKASVVWVLRFIREWDSAREKIRR